MIKIGDHVRVIDVGLSSLEVGDEGYVMNETATNQNLHIAIDVDGDIYWIPSTNVEVIT